MTQIVGDSEQFHLATAQMERSVTGCSSPTLIYPRTEATPLGWSWRM